MVAVRRRKEEYNIDVEFAMSGSMILNLKSGIVRFDSFINQGARLIF